VAIWGGGFGAKGERAELAKLGKLFENRHAIEDIMVRAVQCLVLSCSLGLLPMLHSLSAA